MFCAYCGIELGSVTKFCGNCGKAQLQPPSASSDADDVQFIGSASSVSSFPSIQAPSTRAPSSGSSITSEVRSAKAKAAIQNRASNKDVLPQSSYGVDPRGKRIERRTADLFIIEQGAAPCRLPGGQKQLKLQPQQPIPDWSEWVRGEAREFQAWKDRKNPQYIVEDERRKAWVAMVVGNAPIELALVQENAVLQFLLSDIPDDGKAKIGLMFPIRNLEKEADEDDGSSLSIPHPKRQKSPVGDVVGKGKPKKSIKKEVKNEVKEEVKMGAKNEAEEDIGEFPSIELLTGEVEIDNHGSSHQRKGKKRKATTKS